MVSGAGVRLSNPDICAAASPESGSAGTVDGARLGAR
jgi:hypothetical protein